MSLRSSLGSEHVRRFRQQWSTLADLRTSSTPIWSRRMAPFAQCSSCRCVRFALQQIPSWNVLTRRCRFGHRIPRALRLSSSPIVVPNKQGLARA
eukprot:7644594-Pyramimonas_sp.AAC.1